MKGLVLTHMGRREEGLELVKKGVRLDLTSHIVWHVFGLIQKGEKNYEEALKSYTQALRFDRVCHSFLVAIRPRAWLHQCRRSARRLRLTDHEPCSCTHLTSIQSTFSGTMQLLVLVF